MLEQVGVQEERVPLSALSGGKCISRLAGPLPPNPSDWGGGDERNVALRDVTPASFCDTQYD